MNFLKHLADKAAQIIFTYLIWFAIGIFNLVYAGCYFILEVTLKLKSQIGSLFKVTPGKATGKRITGW
jgi:hypothetical protein